MQLAPLETSGSTIFAELDRDWAQLCAGPAAAEAVERWAGDPVLGAVRSLGDLRQLRVTVDPVAADRVLAALAARADDDPVAARALLQLLIPGLKRLGVRLAGRPEAEVDRELVALAFVRIATYPYQRRPERIAANVLMDVAKEYRRQSTPAVAAPHPPERFAGMALARQRSTLVAARIYDAADELPGAGDPTASATIVRMLERGVRARLFDTDTAAMVWRTRVAGQPDHAVAADLGMTLPQLRMRRSRAVARLADRAQAGAFQDAA